MYWSKQSFTGLGPENRCSSSRLDHSHTCVQNSSLKNRIQLFVVLLPCKSFKRSTFCMKCGIYQIVHGTKGHMAVYGPGCHPQNIIWTEAKLRSIYYFVGDRPVPKLPFGPKCHELFVILYSIHANLSDDMFLLLYI